MYKSIAPRSRWVCSLICAFLAFAWVPALTGSKTAHAQDESQPEEKPPETSTETPTVTPTPEPKAGESGSDADSEEDDGEGSGASGDDDTQKTKKPDTAKPDGGDDGGELSAEELAELEAAMAADSAEQSEKKGGVVATSTPQPVPAQSAQTDYLRTSFILDVAAAYFSDEPLQVGAHDPNRTGFTLQQLEMSLSGIVDPFLTFDANLVFAQFGVEVEEAYATTTALPWNFQMRAGQFLTRFGRLNATHPHAWHFVDQPLVNGKFFGGEGSRGLGAELSWLSPLPWYAEVLTSATDAAGACCARSFFGANDLGIETPADVLVTTALKQFFPLGESLSLLWGLSSQFGPNASGNGNRTEIYGTDLYLRYRPVDSPNRAALSLTVEAMMRQRQVPFDTLRDFGGYASLVWNIDPNWEIGGRHDWTSGVANDPLDPDEDSAHHRSALALTYYPSHFSRVRLQGAFVSPGWRDPFFMTALALELLTGDHGAHGY